MIDHTQMFVNTTQYFIGINYGYFDLKTINKKVLQMEAWTNIILNLVYKEEERVINMKGSEENLSS